MEADATASSSGILRAGAPSLPGSTRSPARRKRGPATSLPPANGASKRGARAAPFSPLGPPTRVAKTISVESMTSALFRSGGAEKLAARRGREAARLSRENKALQGDAMVKATQIEALSGERHALKDNVRTLNEQVARLTAQLNAKSDACAKVTQRYNKLASAMASMTEFGGGPGLSTKSRNRSTDEVFKAALQALTKEKTELDNRVRELDANLRVKEKANRKLEKQVADLKVELANSQKNLELSQAHAGIAIQRDVRRSSILLDMGADDHHLNERGLRASRGRSVPVTPEFDFSGRSREPTPDHFTQTSMDRPKSTSGVTAEHAIITDPAVTAMGFLGLSQGGIAPSIGLAAGASAVARVVAGSLSKSGYAAPSDPRSSRTGLESLDMSPTEVNALVEPQMRALLAQLDADGSIEQATNLAIRLRQLLKASITIALSLDIQDVMESAISQICRMLGADRATMYVVDHVRRELWSRSARGMAPFRVSIDKGIAGFVARTGQTCVISDAYSDPRFNPAMDKLTGYRTRNMLVMPCWRDGRIEAVVQVINKMTSAHFTDVDEVMLALLSTHVGVVVGHAQQHARQRKDVDSLTKMIAVPQQMASGAFEEPGAPIDFLYIAAEIERRACDALGWPRAKVFIVDPPVHLHKRRKSAAVGSRAAAGGAGGETPKGKKGPTGISLLKTRRTGGMWSCMRSRELSDALLAKQWHSVNSGIAGHVATTGQSLSILDPYVDDRFNGNTDLDTKALGLYVAPVVDFRQRIIAVVEVAKNFDLMSSVNAGRAPSLEARKADREGLFLLQTFCAQVSIVLDYANQVADARSDSIMKHQTTMQNIANAWLERHAQMWSDAKKIGEDTAAMLKKLAQRIKVKCKDSKESWAAHKAATVKLAEATRLEPRGLSHSAEPDISELDVEKLFLAAGVGNDEEGDPSSHKKGDTQTFAEQVVRYTAAMREAVALGAEATELVDAVVHKLHEEMEAHVGAEEAKQAEMRAKADAEAEAEVHAAQQAAKAAAAAADAAGLGAGEASDALFTVEASAGGGDEAAPPAADDAASADQEEREAKERKAAADKAAADKRAAEEEAAKAEAAAKPEAEADARARAEAADKAKADADADAEANAKAKAEAEAKAKAEADAKAKAEAEAKEKAEAEATANAEAEARAKAEAEAKAKADAEAEAERQAAAEAEAKAQQEAKEKADAEAKQQEREAAAKQAQAEADEHGRNEARLAAVRGDMAHARDSSRSGVAAADGNDAAGGSDAVAEASADFAVEADAAGDESAPPDATPVAQEGDDATAESEKNAARMAALRGDMQHARADAEAADADAGASAEATFTVEESGAADEAQPPSGDASDEADAEAAEKERNAARLAAVKGDMDHARDSSSKTAEASGDAAPTEGADSATAGASTTDATADINASGAGHDVTAAAAASTEAEGSNEDADDAGAEADAAAENAARMSALKADMAHARGDDDAAGPTLPPAPSMKDIEAADNALVRVATASGGAMAAAYEAPDGLHFWELQDDAGATYYMNVHTHESVWELPEGGEVIPH